MFTLLVDYARIDGSENIPHIKRNFKTYLDVLIEWLRVYTIACMVTPRIKSLKTMKRPRLSILLTSGAQMPQTSILRFSLSKGLLKNVRGRPVLRWISEMEGKFRM